MLKYLNFYINAFPNRKPTVLNGYITMLFPLFLSTIFGIILLLSFCLFPSTPAFASEAAARVEWQYRDNAYGSHPTDMQLLENGNILMVLNGFNAPGVREINRAGEVVWRYDGVQAASARRLPNGNTLIAVSGAPGHLQWPKVIEVHSSGETTTTRYQLPDRSQMPTCAIPLQSGSILVTLRDRALIVNERGEARTLISGGRLMLSPPGSSTENSSSSDTPMLWHLVTARETPSGNILLVDKGIRGRISGQVLEVTPQGRLIRRFNAPNQALKRPVDALRLADGSTLILDLGDYNVHRYAHSGELMESLTFRPVITELPVLNQWRGFLQPNNYFLLSLLYSNNQSLVVEINDKLPIVLLDDHPLLPKGSAFMAEGRLLVPLRPVLEAVEGSLHRDETDRTWTLIRKAQRVTLQTGSTAYSVDGIPRTLPLAPRLVNDSLYIPITLLRDAFGITVKWDGSTRIAEILP